MKRMSKFVALLLVLAMVVSVLAGCGTPAANNNTAPAANNEANTNEANNTVEPEPDKNEGPLVVGYSPFSNKFSPFFSETAYDQDVWAMTQISLLTSDRTGAVITNGIKGETINYGGTDYTYYGPADLKITENADGTVDYDFTMREDLKFSDGTPITIDDVIFSMYVLSDPTYDGSSTLFAQPIKGMKEYRSGMDTLFNLITAAGRDNTDYQYWDEATQKTFWEEADKASVALAQEIVDYCKAAGYNAKEDSVAACAANWGFSLDESATIEDFGALLMESYDDNIADAVDVENAGSTLGDLMPTAENYTTVGIKTGDSAENIEGIQKTGKYSMKVTLTEVDATAIYQLGVTIAPLHYYGETAKYDYDNNKFGFEKGDLSHVRSVTTKPMGAGPYKFLQFANGVVNFEANENYFQGCPKIKYVNFLELLNDGDKLDGVISGSIDISDPSFSKDKVESIKKANSNGELTGDVITTNTVDNLGYGYIGQCAKVMKVGDDPASDASKALRKATATIFAVYRDVANDSYYGDRASTINYPISNTSWAAPHAGDEGYEVAFSKDVDGNQIYTSDMTAEQKYEAAKKAALGWFEKAGYTVADGKLTAAPAGAPMEIEAWIPADGIGDHPAFMILTEAQKAFEEIGFTLKIKDLSNSADLWTALSAQSVAVWTAAWGATVDPDMYQIYFSGDGDRAAGGSNYMYAIDDKELNDLILEARKSLDQSYRKQLYKACLDIIIDWAVEIPNYQRQNAIVFSTQRVDMDTMTPDITTFYGWMSEIQNIELKAK